MQFAVQPLINIVSYTRLTLTCHRLFLWETAAFNFDFYCKMTVQLDSQLGLKALKQALCVRFDWSVPCWLPPRGRSWRPRRRPSRAAASRSPWPRAGNPRRSPPPRRHPPPLASASSAGDGTPSAPPSSRRSINCGGEERGKIVLLCIRTEERPMSEVYKVVIQIPT